MITKEYLESLFVYVDGDLQWKKTRGMAKAGSVAGTVNSRGYRHIRIDNKFYQAHRLVWIYFNSQLPSDVCIDHVNRNRLDNRIENLRLSTNSDNNRNSARSDHYNVGVWKVGERLQTSYNHNGHRQYLGTYDSEEEAIDVRQEYINNLETVA